MSSLNKLNTPNMDRISVKKLINLTSKELSFLRHEIYCNEFKKKKYSYIGLISEVQSYLQGQLIGKNDVKFIKILIKIINKVSKCYNSEQRYIWLLIRTTDSYIWEKTRWHMDGNYYNHNGLHSKFIATLRGPITLIADFKTKLLNKHSATSITSPYEDKNKFKKKIRELKTSEQYSSEQTNKLIEDNCKIMKANYSIIKVGHNGPLKEFNGAIHSEPICIKPNQERVFISILYGTKEEIDDYQNRQL